MLSTDKSNLYISFNDSIFSLNATSSNAFVIFLSEYINKSIGKISLFLLLFNCLI